MSDTTIPTVEETEEQLVQTAQLAVSHCNWVVGACAAKWTERYARGRTDADFATLVGLSPDQIYQRRRVHEAFGDLRDAYPNLKWSHFYVAINWDDASECLSWAEENESTVQEMRAWRRAVRGEDLDAEPPLDEFGGDSAITYVSEDAVAVRDVGDDRIDREGGEGSGSQRTPSETVAIAARETDDGEEYAPFNAGKVTPPERDQGDDLEEVKATPSDEQLLKRMVVTLERVNKELTPERQAKLDDLPEKVKTRLIHVVSQINTKIAGLL